MHHRLHDDDLFIAFNIARALPSDLRRIVFAIRSPIGLLAILTKLVGHLDV